MSIIVLAFLGFLTAASPVSAQESPLIVDADEVSYDQATQIVEARGHVRLQYKGIRLIADQATFDLRQERLVAAGRVVLIDPQGRELRGERLSYDVRTEQAEIFNAETIVDRVFVRSERVETRGTQVTAHNAMITTCDPARPAYRITASRIEIFPGDRIVASRASLWIGSYRVFTLPVYVVSLRSPEETAGSFPRVGYNNSDGLWFEYRYAYSLGPIPSYLLGRAGTRTLRAEAGFRILELNTASVSLGLSLNGGWIRESSSGVESTRFQYVVGLRTPPISLGPRTNWQTTGSFEDSSYGTGHHQAIIRASSAITHQLDIHSSLRLGYDVYEVVGATPFLFDVVPVGDRYNRLSAQFTRLGTRSESVSTVFGTGVSYSFRDLTTSVNASYGERISGKYHWTFGTEYNLNTAVTKLSMDSGLSIGNGTYFTVQAIYNFGTRVFEDLDYILASRICDCIDVSLRYRQVRREIWLEVGVAAFPQSRLQLQFPGLPP